MEIYNICLANGWTIEGTKNAERGTAVKYELFAQFEALDGNITWIYDVLAPNDETIKACKDIAMFGSMREFFVYELNKNGDEWSKKESFNGTFIDALNYIKRHFKTDEF
ncbi:hypothetical protein KDE13_08380 [Campylobacter sp. faydin G-140]|uniref:hypothetical protein n=1 Tax=Campylobacter anatolicus TaxID=2829105 RepID=UPI001B92A2BD|nr:hypothetical protein [Campylobacter anatolicus]MBR8466348.1 hypothetical protein [Campylobacter anatolicus]